MYANFKKILRIIVITIRWGRRVGVSVSVATCLLTGGIFFVKKYRIEKGGRRGMGVFRKCVHFLDLEKGDLSVGAADAALC